MSKRNTKPSTDSIPEIEVVSSVVVDDKVTIQNKRINKRSSTKQKDKLASLNNIGNDSHNNDDSPKTKSLWTMDLDSR